MKELDQMTSACNQMVKERLERGEREADEETIAARALVDKQGGYVDVLIRVFNEEFSERAWIFDDTYY